MNLYRVAKISAGISIALILGAFLLLRSRVLRQPSLLKSGLVEAYTCMNNTGACNVATQEALKRVDPKWGPFDYFCFNERVSHVCSSPNSPIYGDYMSFIKDNSELFGLNPGFSVTLASGTRGEQVYRGLRVAAGVWPSQHRGGGPDGNKNWSEFLVMLTDSSDWSFDPSPKITKEVAIEHAKAYWEPVRPPQISEWRTTVTYAIRAGLPADSDCPSEPVGAWFIRGSGHWNPPGGGNTNSRHMNAIVDGKMGKVCSYYGRNGSDRR